MGNLLIRRREMLQSASSPAPTPSIPSGYVTDGLIFFLDGKQLVSASSWTDIVGNKTFELTNCSLGTNGVVFDGTAYGLYNGRISSDFSNETIEVFIDGATNLKQKSILNQPYMDGSVGISLRFGDGGGTTLRLATGLDGTIRSWMAPKTSVVEKRIGCASYNLAVLNGSKVTGTSQTNYSKNTTGITVLGAHRFSGDIASSSMYIGTIYAVRIYNRKLTEEELKSNQANDLLYYA